uniref:CSON001855 protein n=1 Tax=Culicoides sonorensis TaxID=179676 RepID=A0A336LVE1_CULSO
MELFMNMLNKKFPNMLNHTVYSQSPEFYSNSYNSTVENQYNNIKIEEATQATQYITDMDSLSNNPMLTTASMPIPSRNGNTNPNNRILTDLSEYVFELDTSQSPQLVQDVSYNIGNNTNSGGTMYELQSPPETMLNQTTIWTDLSGPNISVVGKQEPFQMDDSEDIFQVDKADLIQGPTLAELNGDNLYVDLLNIDELIAAEQLSPTGQSLTQLEVLSPFGSENNSAIQSSPVVPVHIFQNQTPITPNNSLQSNPGFYDDLPSSSYKQLDLNVTTTPMHTLNSAAFSPGSHSSNSNSLTLNNSVTPPPNILYQSSTPPNMSNNPGNVGLVQHNPKYTTLHELLLKKDLAIQHRERIRMGQSVPGQHRSALSPKNRLANLQQQQIQQSDFRHQHPRI